MCNILTLCQTRKQIKRHIVSFIEERPEYKKRVRGNKVIFGRPR